MTDPRRLCEAGTELEARLLESAMGDAPRKGLDRKVHVALGIGGLALGAGTTSTTAAAAASKAAPFLGSLGLAKWTGILIVGTGTVVGAAVVHGHAHDPASHAQTPTSATVTARAARAGDDTRPAAPAIDIPAPPAPLPAPPVPAPAEARSTSSSARYLAPASPSSAVSTAATSTPQKAPGPELAAQLAMLDRARTALASDDTQLALTTLDRYDLEYPNGDLAPESLAVRVETYSRRHDDVKVRELGERFLSRYPTHPRAALVATMMKAR
jgi:hypothetical protein